MIDYKSYTYARFGNSEWLILYRTRNDFIKIYSEEAERDDSISMDDFNKVVDYFINTGYDFLTKEELFNAIDNNTKLA
jgi:hypothetical protein